VTPYQVYKAYPESDLLPLDITRTTSSEEACTQGAVCGDTLFLFLLHELCDPHDPVYLDEASKRLSAAIADLGAVKRSLPSAGGLRQVYPPAGGDED